MFGSSILDIAVGVVFIYLLLSLVCTAVNEAFSSMVQKRGSNLFEGIKNLLNNPEFTGLAQQLYNHGLIDGISENAADMNKPTRKPSYIPAEHFSLAILDILGARGVVAAAHGELLLAAERADDLYETAKKEAADNPADASLKAKRDEAETRRTAAELALTTAEQQAAGARDSAAQAAAAAPANSDLAKVAAQAKDAADAAAAAVKMLSSRRAAVNLAANPKDAASIRKASDAVEQALAAARTLASRCPDPLGNIQRAVDILPAGHTRESLHVLIDKTRREAASAGQHVDIFQRNIETWFNDSMTRVGGWYKRWTQKVLFAFAAILVVVANADTITLIRQLSNDSALRSGLLAAAEAEVKNPPASGAPAGDSTSAPSTQAVVDSLSRKAADLELPLGIAEWKKDWQAVPGPNKFASLLADPTLIFSKLFGLLISIFAVSLGAPFWFDTLSKVVNLRGAGTPPGDTKKGTSDANPVILLRDHP